MKILKTASGKKTIKMSRKEWKEIGKKAGWMKKAESDPAYNKLRDKVKALYEEAKRNRGNFNEYRLKDIDSYISSNTILSEYTSMWETFKQALWNSKGGDELIIDQLSSGYTLLNAIRNNVESLEVGENPGIADQEPTKTWDINNI